MVVEDADTLRDVIKSVLEDSGFVVDAVPSAEAGIAELKKNTYACILADFRLPGKNGIDLLHATREISQTVPFILMTAYGSIEIAVEAMKLGANDFVCKPFEPQTLVSVLNDVIEFRRIVDRTLGMRTRRDRSFLTENLGAKKLLYQAKKVAKVDSSVLLLGESGTGKELVARFIHEHSPRSDKPFIAVNCASMPPDLLESELFGHEAGSFTGATQTRIGVFELATEGTIFLDEVGDMPPALQVKLLRALQEREIKRVGSNRQIKVNPRIIAATNQDMEKALSDGSVRDDFYYRIAVVTFEIPPLRARPEDVELLTRYYIDYFCSAIGKSGLTLDETACELLKAYPWPGNSRELENVIERAVILADDIIRPEHLGINLKLDLDAIAETSLTLPEIAQRAARKAEIALITKILEQTLGNKTRAAQILGVSYKTLLNKVKEYNLSAQEPSQPGA